MCVWVGGWGGGTPKDEVDPVVEVGRDHGALQSRPVLKQEVGGGGGPRRQLHISHRLAVLPHPQRQLLPIHQEPDIRKM